MRTFEISLNIERESDLYNPLDPMGQTLSSDITDYINEQLEGRELGESLTLSINCPEPVNARRLHDAMEHFEDKMRRRLEKETRWHRWNSLRLIAIGLVFIIAGILLSNSTHPILITIVETVGSFSIWEAANTWLQHLPRLRVERRILKAISNHTDIRVKTVEACPVPRR